MSANPTLIAHTKKYMVPAPFPGERLVLERTGVKIDIDQMRLANGKWSESGTLWLSNVRMVFIAKLHDAKTGLRAFDIPLLFLKNEKFKQPILGANYIEAKVTSVENPSAPPHSVKLHFREGGVGTFLPLFFNALQMARRSVQQQRVDEAENRPQFAPDAGFDGMVKQAFVDPNDPTRVFLTQPAEIQTAAAAYPEPQPPAGYPTRTWASTFTSPATMLH